MKAHKVTLCSLFLAVAVAAGCSERSTLTSPAAGAPALSSTGSLTDRPYTWTFTCHGGSGIFAEWSWTANGTPIAYSSASCFGDQSVSGNGVRPADANGFAAVILNSSKSWTFDPAGPFKAGLSGSAFGQCNKNDLVCLPSPKEDGKLTVDS